MNDASEDTQPDGRTAFRLGYVPGTTPAKWVRTWRARLTVPLELVALETDDAGAAVGSALGGSDAGSDDAGSDDAGSDDAAGNDAGSSGGSGDSSVIGGSDARGDVDAALVRRPVRTHDDVGLRARHAIPLYDEVPVVVVGKEHLFSLENEVALADLADETVWHPLDDRFDWDALAAGEEPTRISGTPPGEPGSVRPAHAKEAVEIVAAGVGVVVLPMSIARLHHRRDVVAVPLSDGPPSGVSLVWPAVDANPLCEEFVGIVRGRSVNSSRGAAAQDQASSNRDGQSAGARAGGGGTGSAALTRAGEARRKKAAATRAQADRTAAQQRKRGDQSRAKGKGTKRGR